MGVEMVLVLVALTSCSAFEESLSPYQLCLLKPIYIGDYIREIKYYPIKHSAQFEESQLYKRLYIQYIVDNLCSTLVRKVEF